MANIKIHAGDFLKGNSSLTWPNALFLKTTQHPFLGEQIELSELEEIETASEESVKKFGGTVGWGVAGALIFGAVGLLAGLLVGGRKKEVTFVAKFKDGRKLLATTDNKTFIKLQAATFQSKAPQRSQSTSQIKQRKTTSDEVDKVKDTLQQLEQQHATPVTSKDATTASSKSGSSHPPILFFVKKGDVVRRLSSSQLQAAVANGEFGADDHIRKSENDKWTRLSNVKGLNF